MPKLVLLRHGQSQWNLENRFTGWKDVDLTEKGKQEAAEAGRLLAAEQLQFDCAYTSVLKRAIRTLWIVLDEMDLMWIPVTRAWQLNERHYGALQGLNKTEIAVQYGEQQVKLWRRSYDLPPPPMDKNDERHPLFDGRYRNIEPSLLPSTECLKDTVARVMPFFDAEIAPKLRAQQTVLITAHGNSLRALIKSLEGISEADIVEMNVPTGVPLLYDLDNDLRPLNRRYLGDPVAIEAAMQSVANQGNIR